MEGDTTNYYLYKRLNKYDISLTTLARGVAIGDELEYTDEITLDGQLITEILTSNDNVNVSFLNNQRCFIRYNNILKTGLS